MTKVAKYEKNLTGREIVAWCSYVCVVGSVLFLGTTLAAQQMMSLAKVMTA